MYQLYIGRYQNVSAKYSYFGGKYLLVFSDKKPNGDFKKVPQKNEDSLESDEKRWLLNCKTAVNAEHIKEHESDYTEILNVLCDRFEIELQKQVKRINENGEASNESETGDT